MIDAETETIIRLTEVPGVLAELGIPDPPCVDTVRRWWRRGEFEGFRVGWKVFTSREAVKRYLAAGAIVAEAEPPGPPLKRPRRLRLAAIEANRRRTDEILREAGIA